MNYDKKVVEIVDDSSVLTIEERQLLSSPYEQLAEVIGTTLRPPTDPGSISVTTETAENLTLESIAHKLRQAIRIPPDEIVLLQSLLVST